MRTIPTASRPGRSRSRRAAFATTALLAGCATAGRDAALVQSFAGAAIPGQTSAVLFRVVPPGAAVAVPIAGARLWQLDGGERSAYAVPVSPSRAARGEGWLLHTHLRPGTWFMRLEGAGGSRAAAPADITFRIPPAPPSVTYVGTFRVACDAAAAPAAARPCRVQPVPVDESAAAAALVRAEGSGVAAPVTALARPYPPSFAATGLAPPTVPEFRVDTRLWLAAIDWTAVTAGGALPAPPAGEPQGRLDQFDDAEMASTSSMGGQIGGAIGGGMGAAAGAGGIFALGAMLAVIVVVVPIVLIAQAIAKDQRERRTAEEARRQAEALRTAALAQEQWGPCSAGIAAALAPANVERHLRTTLSPTRAAGRQAALPGPWQATVTRVIFRHCGATPDSHGVEVATRWTAMRPGDSEPAFDAAFSRTVAGATPDARLVHSARPPWEVSVASEAACRPLADYCGAGGSALLLQEVTRGVTEARDAIAAMH
jgi:hypothetical protein